MIDDSRFSRNMVMRALREAGYEVFEAPDGIAGLEAVREHRPDCVVLDLLMPVLDGPGFLERLRSDGSRLPVVVATADIQAATRSLCEGLGISGFLNKPVRTRSCGFASSSPRRGPGGYPMTLGPDQEDALKEVINIGMSRAAATLSELMQTRIELTGPRRSGGSG